MAESTTTSKLPRSSSSYGGQSSPSAALEAIGARPRLSQRRPTKPASYELANHAKAYLEGGKVASGFEFLYSLLAAGTSISTPAQPYIGFLAPPAYIAFASSVVVDPLYTTQALSSDARNGADAALRYLQCVQTTIDDPVYPTIRQAFKFPEERRRRRGPGFRSEANSLSPGEPGGDIEQLAGPSANEKSLWRNAEDFWHITGWAFNCSITHKKRWDRWKIWMGIMLDFLEADWEACIKESTDAADPVATAQKCLVWSYIVGDTEAVNRSTRRRIVKAILATASPESQKDYPEIWQQETYAVRQKAQKDGPVGKIDFETGDIGDYASDDEMQDILEAPDYEDELLMSNTSAYGESIRNVVDACERLGGQDAIELRQRLITLLAQVALALPAQFTTLSDFFDNILEDVIQLPIFMFYILITTMTVPGRVKVAFLANLLLPLVSGSVPDYFRFEPAPDHLETKLLLFKASTQSFAANTKISLILEQIFIYTMDCDTLTPTKKLRKAMEDGIKARESVYGTGKGKKGNAEEEMQAKELMEASSNRLLGLLEMLEMSPRKQTRLGIAKRQKGEAPATASFSSGSSLSSAPKSETDV
ncbi:hypothetical protein LEMA_P070210.1 [Plenodomus lingam JN3]|uniref:Uncharacterized protein n=1 Tax=Leptosphaeria maculans (strain JN3 / isolate v23.1.3 / race Av1-4-5-6-7-8) TaxID=985895 RepID=E4ZJ82_LEPMJ|nr:hypothetical protein LEMA_P070210.1 [Plenodomus lingam JN3]CBX91513.1 hypothetical protein LEMA_P070210.1 [Plenodomus lingam JN3]